MLTIVGFSGWGLGWLLFSFTFIKFIMSASMAFLRSISLLLLLIGDLVLFCSVL